MQDCEYAAWVRRTVFSVWPDATDCIFFLLTALAGFAVSYSRDPGLDSPLRVLYSNFVPFFRVSSSDLLNRWWDGTLRLDTIASIHII